MPIGDFIAETVVGEILRAIFEILFYYTGALVITLCTFGQLPLAPLLASRDINKGKSRWNDWSIWHILPDGRRALRAENVSFVGLLVWLAAGVAAYFIFRTPPAP